MQSNELIRSARKRSGLTQQELAERLEVSQGELSRWESGRTSPSLTRVVEIVRATGFDLSVSLVPYDTSDDSLIAQQLLLSPLERLRSLEHMIAIESQLSSLTKLSSS